MGFEVKSVKVGSKIDLQKLGYDISDWMLNTHKFSVEKREWSGTKFLVKLTKSNFMRQLSGLVYQFEIELDQIADVVTITINDGDLRKQLVALGLAWFIAWPFLITAGWAMYHNGDFRRDIFAQIESLALSQT